MRSVSTHHADSCVAEKILMFEEKSGNCQSKFRVDTNDAGTRTIRPSQALKRAVPLKIFGRSYGRADCPKVACNFGGNRRPSLSIASSSVTDTSDSVMERPFTAVQRQGDRETDASCEIPKSRTSTTVVCKTQAGQTSADGGDGGIVNDAFGLGSFGRSFSCASTFAPTNEARGIQPRVDVLSFGNHEYPFTCENFSPQHHSELEEVGTNACKRMANRSGCAFLDEEDLINNNYKGLNSKDEKRGKGANYETKVLEEYESDSSCGLLYCREKCVCCCNSDDCSDSDGSTSDTDGANRRSRTELTSDTDDSDGANSIDFSELTAIYGKTGSTKRSSTALNDYSQSEYQRVLSKRFRTNEELDVDSAKYRQEYLCDEESSESPEDDSSIATSSYTAEAAIYNPISPIAAQEAEYDYEYVRPNLPESCDSQDEYDPEDSAACDSSDFEEDCDDESFSSLFYCPTHHLPFQLHPTHNEDLEEYYNFMQRKELLSHPANCLRGQPKIKHSMRRILVEWLTKISHHYKLNGQSLHLTVNVLDRYTDRQKGIYRGHYQLLGVTSLLVATKQLEVDIPPVATCLMLCRNLYSKTQLLSLERHLLDILQFDLNVPTAHTFLDYFIISLHHEHHGPLGRQDERQRHSLEIPYLKKLLCVSRCFLDYGLADYEFCQYLPSIAARAAMNLARELLAAKQEHTALRIGDGVYSRILRSLRPEEWLSHSSAAEVSCSSFSPLTPYGSSLDQSDVERCCNSLRVLIGKEKLLEIERSLKAVVEKYSFE